MGRSRNLGLVAALTTAASFSMTGTTSAAPLEKGEFHDEFSFTDPNFCDVPGLTVEIEGEVEGTFLGKRQGRDGLVYFMEHIHVSTVQTNVNNSEAITTEERSISKDLKVIDNGDGTLTITVLATGNFAVYGADGKAIVRNPGQVRFQFIVDHGGTPADPSDDVELEDLGVIKGSTGRSDDFCGPAVLALT
jgi:hypothetical protein